MAGTIEEQSPPGLPWLGAGRGGWRWTVAGRALKELRDRLRLRRVARALVHLHGEARPRVDRDSWFVMALVRNAAAHVPSFLRHHLDQGAGHVIVVDNGSEDDTVALARRFPRTTIFQCLLPFRSFEWLIRRHLVERFARGRWSLTVDADERFDYPFSKRVSMRSLLAYLDAHGYTAVVAYLLDRFPGGPLMAGSSRNEPDPVALHTLYDLSGLRSIPYERVLASANNRLSNPAIEWLYGGVRQTAFGVEESLTKQPLVLFDRGTVPRPAHHVRGAHIADFTAVLHHFKFAGGFAEYQRRIVEEESFPHRSTHSRRILQCLDRDPEMSLTSPTARRYVEVDQLVDEGFLIVSAALRAWAEELGEEGAP